jgi:hypothetical protein
MFGRPVQVPERVRPGDTIDMAVSLISPSTDGNFTGQWVFSDGEEEFGNNGSRPFTFNINVLDSPPNPVFDFSAQMCQGYWQSNARVARNRIQIEDQMVTNLPCDGRAGNPVGFVRRLDTPNMESGEINTVSGIWSNPPEKSGGIIQGYFPAMLIFSGDEFYSQVGCRSGAEDCNVTFQLRYRVIVPPNNVVSENSYYIDKQYTGALDTFSLNLDSLGLVGQYVSFILMVRANNDSDENQAVWVGPRIVR